jgi:hypothetical protein
MNLGFHGRAGEDEDDLDENEYEYDPVVLAVAAYRRNARCRRARFAASLARACLLAVARA